MRICGENKQEIMNDLNKLLAELTGELDSKRAALNFLLFLQRSIYSLIKNKYKHI